jgi:hypothetical protein
MKLYMDGGAEPHCSRVKSEKAKSLDQKYWRMQRNKFKWFTKVWRLPSLDRRAMQIKEEQISHLKSEISYTSKSHLWEVPANSGSKGSEPQDMSDHSRLLTVREKWLINLSYHHSCQKCMMCFTYHSWRSSYECQRSNYLGNILTLKEIWPTAKGQPRSWTAQNEWLAVR